MIHVSRYKKQTLVKINTWRVIMIMHEAGAKCSIPERISCVINLYLTCVRDMAGFHCSLMSCLSVRLIVK
jgi:hypothetical protein